MIQEFLIYLKDIRGYSANTIHAYGKDLTSFVRWMKKHDARATWSTITREDIDAYSVYMAESGMKPASSNRHLASISSLYGYFRRQGLPVDNPCRFASRRKIGANIPNTIPVDELQQAYTHAEGCTKIMIGLLATTGVRISELLSLEWSDIDFYNCSIRIHGKGMKQRIVPTTYESLRLLEDIKQHTHADGRLFHFDQRHARYMIWAALKPFSQAHQLSPHAIRHTMATNMANHGTNVTTIAKVLGHSDIKTTQKYIDMTQADTRKAVLRHSIIN